MLIPHQEVLPRPVMEKIKGLILEYYPKGEALLKILEQTALVQDAKNRRLRAERGQVDQENLEILGNVRNLTSKVYGNLQIVADLMGFDLAPLEIGEAEQAVQEMDGTEENISQGLFESDEDREMYEILKKMEIPEVREDEKKPDTQLFEDIIKRLQQCVTLKLIDDFAASFYKIAYKQNRKKLVNTLFAVSRNSLSLLPYYSRLAATLSQDYK
jgi:hypothetical protein